MKVELEKDVAQDLVLVKLRLIRQEIEKIKDKWNIQSIDSFIKDVKSGKIGEGENDAIVLRQLVEDEQELDQLYADIR